MRRVFSLVSKLPPVALGYLFVFWSWLWRQTSEAAPVSVPVLYGSGTSPDVIPRIIWLYWEQADVPLLVRTCVIRVRALNPSCVVHFLNPDTLRTFVADLPDFSGSTVQKKTDWVRLYLLQTRGGIWVDASTLLTESLDWVFEAQRATGAEYVGFYIESFTVDRNYPVIENWFMAAVPGSSFVKKWFEIFDTQVVRLGTEKYLDGLRERGVYEKVTQNILPSIVSYLSMHLAGQDAMQSMGVPRLALFRAEDTAFFYQTVSKQLVENWGGGKLRRYLLFRAAPAQRPKLIKLRAVDRKYVNLFLRTGAFRSSSYFGEALLQSRNSVL